MVLREPKRSRGSSVEGILLEQAPLPWKLYLWLCWELSGQGYSPVLAVVQICRAPHICLPFHCMPCVVSIVGFCHSMFISVDSFEFLCSNLTFINMQLIQSSSLLFHGEAVWHKLQKIPSPCHLMLYSCSRIFPSFFCMFLPFCYLVCEVSVLFYFAFQ